LDLGWAGVALVAFVMLSGYRNVARAIRWDLASAPLRVAFFFVSASYNLTEHAFRELHPVWIGFLLAVIAVPEPLVQDSPETIDEFERSPRCADLSIAQA
jgi:hypothetical protein